MPRKLSSSLFPKIEDFAYPMDEVEMQGNSSGATEFTAFLRVSYGTAREWEREKRGRDISAVILERVYERMFAELVQKIGPRILARCTLSSKMDVSRDVGDEFFLIRLTARITESVQGFRYNDATLPPPDYLRGTPAPPPKPSRKQEILNNYLIDVPTLSASSDVGGLEPAKTTPQAEPPAPKTEAEKDLGVIEL